MTFESAVAFTLRPDVEGGVSNDSQDPGGLTKWGISSKQYPEVLEPAFSREKALAIYRRDFWDHCRCGELPDSLDLIVFDTAVNHGSPNAVRWLQQALGLTTDGVVGPATLRAARTASPGVSIDVLSSRALNYARDAGFLHFGRGWMRRLFKLQFATKELS